MNRKEIIKQLKISVPQLKNIANGLGISLDHDDFSFAEVGRIEAVFKIIEAHQCDVDQALLIYQKERQTPQGVSLDYLSMIDGATRAVIEAQADAAARKIAADSPEMFRRQKEAIQYLMAKKFWERFNELAKSGQLKAAFDKAMSEDGILDADIIRGESPALPDSSSSES